MSDLQISKLHNEHEQNTDCNSAPNLDFSLNNMNVFNINLKENWYLNTLYVYYIAMNHCNIGPSCVSILVIN